MFGGPRSITGGGNRDRVQKKRNWMKKRMGKEERTKESREVDKKKCILSYRFDKHSIFQISECEL
jgi:hypothetical protein